MNTGGWSDRGVKRKKSVESLRRLAVFSSENSLRQLGRQNPCSVIVTPTQTGNWLSIEHVSYRITNNRVPLESTQISKCFLFMWHHQPPSSQIWNRGIIFLGSNSRLVLAASHKEWGWNSQQLIEQESDLSTTISVTTFQLGLIQQSHQGPL